MLRLLKKIIPRQFVRFVQINTGYYQRKYKNWYCTANASSYVNNEPIQNHSKHNFHLLDKVIGLLP
jgi:hypothetical protein